MLKTNLELIEPASFVLFWNRNQWRETYQVLCRRLMRDILGASATYRLVMLLRIPTVRQGLSE